MSNGQVDPASFVLSDDQWEQIAAILPSPRSTGRPRSVDLRMVVEAILTVDDQHLKWRQLASRYPNAPAIRYYYDLWKADGTWPRIAALVAQFRESHLS
jgi:transposase